MRFFSSESTSPPRRSDLQQHAARAGEAELVHRDEELVAKLDGDAVRRGCVVEATINLREHFRIEIRLPGMRTVRARHPREIHGGAGPGTVTSGATGCW